MRSPALATAAAVVLVIEAAALVGFALVDMFGLGAGDAASMPTAIALIALTLIGAAALFAFAVGALRGAGWARSGGVVAQLLAIALAATSFGVTPVPWTFILAVGIPGVVGFVLLVASARREAGGTRTEQDAAAPADD